MIKVYNPSENIILLSDVREANKNLKIEYDENTGIVWTLNTPSIFKMFCIPEEFSENGIYQSFEELYSTIESGKPYKPLFEEDLYANKAYQSDLITNYYNLYDNESGNIRWISDENNMKTPNFLNVIKTHDEFILYFVKNRYNPCSEDAINFKMNMYNSMYGDFCIPFVRHYENILKLTKK